VHNFVIEIVIFDIRFSVNKFCIDSVVLYICLQNKCICKEGSESAICYWSCIDKGSAASFLL